MQLGCGHVAIWCYVQRRCRAHEQQGPLHKKSHRALVARDAMRSAHERKLSRDARKKPARESRLKDLANTSL